VFDGGVIELSPSAAMPRIPFENPRTFQNVPPNTSTKHARSTTRFRFSAYHKHENSSRCVPQIQNADPWSPPLLSVFSLAPQNVHLTGKQQFIEVAGRKAKTRQRRIVSVSDNLSSWLKPVARVAGPVARAAANSLEAHSLAEKRAPPLLRLLSPGIP
jgi:hypothetical protein